MKQLGLSIQSFEKFRTKQCLYVDKTEIIYRLITSGRIYLLSRPRWFGKSLLISTLEALFRGKKELFEGLYIYDKWKWEEDEHPVIKIDWTGIAHSTPEAMKESLIFRLNKIAKNHQLTLNGRSEIDCFRELVRALHKKTGKGVVILIDDYDMPVAAHFTDANVMTFRTIVDNFYQVIKGVDEHLHFVLLTGVSKFSGASIFSSFNSPEDITLHREYAAICGYTYPELEATFSEYIDRAAERLQMAREKLLGYIRQWYGGYTWDGKTAIYNPCSTLNFLNTQEFVNHWFYTGTPAFLIDLIHRHNAASTVLEPFVVDDSSFNECDPANLSAATVLFHTGCLTIQQLKLINGVPEYTLGIPNLEVSESLLVRLLLAFGKYPDIYYIEQLCKRMQQQVASCDEAGFADSLEMIIATAPSEHPIPFKPLYRTLTLLWLRLLGFKVRAEEYSYLRRPDAVWEQPEQTVVVEIKYDAEKSTKALLKAAMQQIDEQQYYNKYLGKVLLLAIAFSKKQAGCKMELKTKN
ncbi:MAG: AAA family ATPase [Prevotellaceae bacterium]|jgi:hypothetical protein|nr:AAA family ATPase [Prevotellaceae bacterium]